MIILKRRTNEQVAAYVVVREWSPEANHIKQFEQHSERDRAC